MGLLIFNGMFCVFGALFCLYFVNCRPLEGADEPTVGKNLPQVSRVVKSTDDVLAVRLPGCCKPGLYLPFDGETSGKRELHERLAQLPTKGNGGGPCGNYVNLGTEKVQFKGATLAAVTDAITIAVWVKLKLTNGIHPILVLESDAGELRFELFEGYLSWRYTGVRPSLARFEMISEKPIVSANVWTHLLVQYDAQTRRSAVFLNGEEFLTGSANGGSMELSWGELTSIGKHSVNELITLKFKGFMDEFYIYFCSVSEILIRSLAQDCDVKKKCLDPAADAFCAPGEHSSPSQEGRCVSCYCAGRSQNCSRANLYLDRVILDVNTPLLDSKLFLVNIEGNEIPGVKYSAGQTVNEYVAHNLTKGLEYYWALPKAFLGNKLSSYGGRLRYSVKHSPDKASTGIHIGGVSRQARDLRDQSEVVFENTYSMDPEEQKSDGSGVTSIDSSETVTVVKISTKEKPLDVTEEKKSSSEPTPGTVTQTVSPETFPSNSYFASDASSTRIDGTTALDDITDVPTTESTLQEAHFSVPHTLGDGRYATIPTSFPDYAVPEAGIDSFSSTSTHAFTDHDAPAAYTSDDGTVQTLTPISGTLSHETNTTEVFTTAPNAAFIDFDSEKPALIESSTLLDTPAGTSDGQIGSSIDKHSIEASTTMPDSTLPSPIASRNDQDEITTVHRLEKTTTISDTSPFVPLKESNTVPSEIIAGTLKPSIEDSQENASTTVVSSFSRDELYATEKATKILDIPFTEADPLTGNQQQTTTYSPLHYSTDIDEDSKEEMAAVPFTSPNSDFPITSSHSITEEVVTIPLSTEASEGQDSTTSVVFSFASISKSTVVQQRAATPKTSSISKGTSTVEPDGVHSTIDWREDESAVVSPFSDEYTIPPQKSVEGTTIFEPPSTYSTVETNMAKTKEMPTKQMEEIYSSEKVSYNPDIQTRKTVTENPKVFSTQTNSFSHTIHEVSAGTSVRSTTVGTTVVPEKSTEESGIPMTETDITKPEDQPSVSMEEATSYLLTPSYITEKSNVESATSTITAPWNQGQKATNTSPVVTDTSAGEASTFASFSAIRSDKQFTEEVPTTFDQGGTMKSSEVSTLLEMTHSPALTTTVTNTPASPPNQIRDAVRMVGIDGTTVFYDEVQPGDLNFQRNMAVHFTEGKWHLADGSQTSRNILMRVLSNVNAIYVRAFYGNGGPIPATLSIKDVSVDMASERDAGFGKTELVEQCECPEEYNGLSCESCKPGYFMSRNGSSPGTCMKCDCHGHSEVDCDPDTGHCRNCDHNSEGFRCEQCQSGFYGNASNGTPTDCKPCPCPLTESTDRVGSLFTCFMADDGQPTCDACPQGHTGRTCQKCEKPYEGDPTSPGGRCVLRESIRIDCECDANGSVNDSCDPETRQCYCKKHVEGRTCNKCKRSFFNLHSDEPDGCIECFCFGVSKDCKCADYYKNIEHLRFVVLEGADFLRLSDLSRGTIISTGFRVEGDPHYVVFENYDKIPTGTYYWFLGKEFRGDMITSYDGIMRYRVSHEMDPDGALIVGTDVQITGRNMVLIFRHGRRLEGGENALYGLKLSEDWLKFPDGSRVTREQVLTVLSAVESILVRATYSNTTKRSILYDVTLEKGVSQYSRFGKARNIELCACPPGYLGTSCQHCARGYTRSYPGPEFTPCMPCNCNQHSKDCNPENGRCMRCDHNTTGSTCQQCIVGFYGDPTKGTPRDCQVCPCPLTISTNQFSRICKLESDGKPTCTACQTGYTGRNCERCANGYIGNPSNPGEKCFKIPVSFLPTVKVRPMKRIKEEGDNALFYCFARGPQTLRFSWSRKNGQPMSRRVSIKGKRLTIEGVKKEDEGTYLCTARNVYGSKVSSGQLTVKDRLEDPIVVSVSPKVLHVPLNHSAQFLCKAKSATDYELKWTRGMHGPLPNGAVNVNGLLRIRSTQSIHSGSYTCTAKNSFSDDMASIQLRVGVTSPQVYTSPVRLSVREGDPAQFRCSASGFPAPVLQWHGGPGGRLPPEAILSHGNGVLTFPVVKEIYEGQYFCTASNMGGISSTSAFLDVSAAGSAPVISVSPSSLTVTEGEEAMFDCKAAGNPPPTIRWSRANGQTLESSLAVSGVLRIFPTRPEDEGAYACTAANSFGAKAFLVTLDVKRDTSAAPTAFVTPANQTVNVGDSTMLLCQVTGDPYPAIQWSKVGSTLTDNHVVEGTLLRVREVTKEDEGMYVCVAQNKRGVKQATGIVTVRKKVLPTIVIMPARTQTVAGGETATFRCVVKAGNPPPAVVWKREESETLNSTNDGLLVISHATGDSQGKYICEAKNALGSTEAVALLVVQGGPKVILSPSSPVVVTSGSPVTLECATAGDPTPIATWHSPRQSQSNLKVIESVRGVLKLIIEDTRQNDQGNYTCQARNLVGVTRESVQLIVLVPNEPPEIFVEPLFQTVIEGEKVVFHCNASGVPSPTIAWQKLGSHLTNDTLYQNGLLTMDSASSSDAGSYVCKAVNREGEDSLKVQLEVIVPPKVNITPSEISVREGNAFSINCVVKPSLPVTWSKINGSIFVPKKNGTGTLFIKKAELRHAGKYRCNASNAAGSSEGFAQVIIYVAPIVAAWPESVIGVPNSNVTFQCNASGIPKPVISWRKEGGDIPRRHSIAHGVLKMTSLVGEDDGRYICTASNTAGASAINVGLTVEASPSVTIEGGKTVHTVSVAGNLTLPCIGTGIPQPQVQWFRVVSPMSQLITSKGGLLVIRNAQHFHAGTYKCEVANRAGSVHAQVVILVQEAPKVTIIPQKSRIKIGESAKFTCITSGSPVPQLTWWKLNDSLPTSSTVHGAVMKIRNATEKDAGIYVCSALNDEGSANGRALLEMKVPVPRFTQKPLSYLTLPQLTEEPLNFTIEMVLIPEIADGLILYNDQRSNGSVGDFISFGMSDGFAEFRFNLGFEPAIIRSQQPLPLYEWHEIVLERYQREGKLTIDGKPHTTGVSKGKSTGLNLNQDLYVGGVPDFSAISTLSGFKSGFVGCLSYLVIDGKKADLGTSLNRLGLEDCEVCQTRPCKNGGTCTEVTRDWTFVCNCRYGYSGKTCRYSGQRCSPGVCNRGRCENVGSDGFRCVCPAGFTGDRCEQGIPIDTPMFEGNSFMSFPGIEGAARQLKFSMTFMVLKSRQNMLLLYNGQKAFPDRGDFISLAINNGQLEFRFDMGSGPGLLRSAKNFSLGIWHTVSIGRQLDEAIMKFDDDLPVKGYSRCCSVGLNLGLDLFIGGVDNFSTVDINKIGVSTGFFGCISRVSVDGREINLPKSNLNQRGIKQCAGCLLPCEIKPCLNNATCIPVGNSGFLCSCAPGYTGEKCEAKMFRTRNNGTCLNGGVQSSASNRTCGCPIGYGGRRCETSLSIGDSVSFSGDGFLQFPAFAMQGSRVTTRDYVSLEIKTEAPDGIILWQGRRRDHIAVGLRKRFVEFRFELGSGPAVLLSEVPLNDGQWHSVEVYRSFRDGSLKVDKYKNVTGTSAKGSRGLNIDDDSHIFIGGGLNVVDMTYGKFNTGFIGCIRNVKFKMTRINLQREAVNGRNVLQCDAEMSRR